MSSMATFALAETEFGRAFTTGFSNTSRFLMTRGARPDVAAEIAQAAWARGWECRSQLVNLQSLGSWINSIAHNMLRNWLRRETRYCDLEKTSVPAISSTPSVDLGPMLNRCRQRDLELLTDFYVNGYTAREIAKRTGLCATTVRVRLLRSRRYLRAQLR